MQLINIGNKNTNPLNMIKLAEASNGLEPGKPTIMAFYTQHGIAVLNYFYSIFTNRQIIFCLTEFVNT